MYIIYKIIKTRSSNCRRGTVCLENNGKLANVHSITLIFHQQRFLLTFPQRNETHTHTHSSSFKLIRDGNVISHHKLFLQNLQSARIKLATVDWTGIASKAISRGEVELITCISSTGAVNFSIINHLIKWTTSRFCGCNQIWIHRI